MPANVARGVTHMARSRVARPLGVLVAILGLALALAACSKCDVPNLLPRQAGPQSCHDGPPPQ